MITSKESFESWLGYMQNYRNYSENTCISYKIDVEVFLRYAKEKLSHLHSVSDLKLEHIHKWLADATETTGRSVRANSRAICSIKNFLGYMSVMEGVKVQPEILNMKPPKFVKPLPRMMSEEEVKFSQILKLGENDNADERWMSLCDKAIILLMYGAGLRITEALEVNFINSIDLENMLIVVNGKGGKTRIVPLLPMVLEALMDYIIACPWIEMEGYKNLHKLFFTKNQKLMSRNYFSNRIRQHAVKYNLPYKISPHSFRHSFATHLLENGVSINEVQKLLGHANLSSTEIYTQVSNGLLREMYYASHPDA